MMINKKTAIISSEKFAGKIAEDIWLRDALCDIGEAAEIVAWEDENISWTDYKSAVLRSCWGYHKRVSEFLKFLKKLDLANVRLFNDSKIVKWNIQKKKQFEDLKRLGIKTVPTVFIQEAKADLIKIMSEGYLGEYKKLVIKPSISGSGDNTYLICREATKLNLKNSLSPEEAQAFYESYNWRQQNVSIMLQPFLEGIEAGEYSFVFIDSQLTHVAVRYPGILGPKKDTAEVQENLISDDVMLFAHKCQEALNYMSDKLCKGCIPVYSRCDIVRNGDKLYLMEAEMTEPDLLIRAIHSEQKRADVLKKLANTISIRSK